MRWMRSLGRVAAELDAWLTEQESAVADVVPGTAKTILWADEEPGGRRTDIALVYLHGFSATRRELSPTIERVGEELGANVFFTRLAGHGRTAEALGQATVEDWKADVREAWEIERRIGERVEVIGTSTGASLALWLATQEEFAAAGADAPLERVATPTVMFYTEQDDVVSVPALKEAFGRIGAEVVPAPTRCAPPPGRSSSRRCRRRLRRSRLGPRAN